ncbi:hypothetical protein KFU94_27325 [Chloroflexi bacterium TSY]|nr:hypothetical protein [Chloroflexi bacterium TSY]
MASLLSPTQYLTVKSKLILLLLFVAIGSLLVVAVVVGRTQRATLNQAAFDQLVSQRNNKAEQVKLYIESIRNQGALLATDRVVVAAMMALQDAYARISSALIEPVWDEALTHYYRSKYLPALSQHAGIDISVAALRPKSRGARFLQYHYIVTDSVGHIDGNKSETLRQTSALYHVNHDKYHPQLEALASRLGFSDLLLVSYDNEEVVYSVSKNPDLGTNLRSGPYSQTHLSDLVKCIKQEFDESGISIVDFASYPPAEGKPVAFLGSIIYNPAGRPLGILVIQFAPDELDRIVTDDRAWRESRQGETGETYIVGRDQFMRTTSRFLIENPETYLQELRAAGEIEETLSQIGQFKRSILLQEVETEAAREALSGRSDVRILDDYRGHSVLTAYAPLDLDGLTWGIISQRDAVEAFAPIATLQRRIFMVGTILIILVTLMAVAASTLLTRPLHRLTEFTESVLAEEEVFLDADSEDEFGQLTESINDIAMKMQFQTAMLEQHTEENEVLLHSILPGPVAQRIKRGEDRITDTLQQISVLSATILGFVELLEQRDAQEATDILNDLIQAWDEAADSRGLERQRTVGDTYLAICGLSRSKFGVFGDFQSRLQGFWSHLFRFRLQKTTYFISENRPNLTQKLDIDRQICIYVNCLARILSQNLKFGSTGSGNSLPGSSESNS